MERNHPHLTEYGHHYRAMLASETEKNLKAVGESINKTVPAGHKDLIWLQQSYRVRRDEIREAAKKAKEEAERVAAAK